MGFEFTDSLDFRVNSPFQSKRSTVPIQDKLNTVALGPMSVSLTRMKMGMKATMTRAATAAAMAFVLLVVCGSANSNWFVIAMVSCVGPLLCLSRSCQSWSLIY